MKKFAFYIFLIVLLFSFSLFSYKSSQNEINILSYTIDSEKQELNFYWKDDNGNNYLNFQNLKAKLENNKKKLVFATNGGMYNKALLPQGLYIENGKLLKDLDTIKKSSGNFYLQPNGVFYLSDKGIPNICITKSFVHSKSIKYATQSGPMLLIDGKIHSKFNYGSKNINIRNGVGILPNGNLLFAMSKEKINFYDFASFFKNKGCEHALYLDGFVSKTYLPSKNWEQIDGNFGECQRTR